MNKYPRLLPLTAAVLLAACTPAEDNHRVVGELASDRIEITAEVSEPITNIAVAEGESVVSGQLLVEQNSARAAARLGESEAVRAQAQARLDELVRGPRRERIEAARASEDGAARELEFRRTEHERIQKLAEQELVSPDLLDRARAALDAAAATLDLRRAQLEELLAGTTLEELQQAEQAVRQSEARLESTRIDLERHQLHAPVDGVMDSRLFEQGERPQPGQPVLVMLGGSQPYARVYIPENYRVLIKPGTPARIFVDGLAEPIEGTTRWVASEAAFTPYYALTERDRGRLSYAAKIDIVGMRERLPDGVPVEVEFLVDGILR